MKPARILIVDDEPLIRQSLAGVLEDEGYQTDAVATGEECLAELTRNAYDLVLLDVWLPGMDGLETLARLENIAFADRPVVVIVSGHGTIETAVKATMPLRRPYTHARRFSFRPRRTGMGHEPSPTLDESQGVDRGDWRRFAMSAIGTEEMID